MALRLPGVESSMREAMRPRLTGGTFTDVKVEGLAELEKALNDLSEDVSKNVLRKALREGGKIILDDAKARAPSGVTGMLRAGMLVGTKIRGLGAAGSRIIVKLGLRKQPKEQSAWYGRLLEFGTGGEYVLPRAKPPSKRARQMIAEGTGISPRPFMRPAFDSKKQSALDRIIAVLRERIAKAKARRL